MAIRILALTIVLIWSTVRADTGSIDACASEHIYLSGDADCSTSKARRTCSWSGVNPKLQRQQWRNTRACILEANYTLQEHHMSSISSEYIKFSNASHTCLFAVYSEEGLSWISLDCEDS